MATLGIKRRCSQLLLWRTLGSKERNGVSLWHTKAGDDSNASSEDSSAIGLRASSNNVLLPCKGSTSLLRDTAWTASTLASRRPGLPFSAPHSIDVLPQQQQQRGLSWRRFVPSLHGIRGALEGPDRQVTNLMIAINLATYIMAKYDRGVYVSMAGVPYAIMHGEWYRLLSSGFLHTGFLHLLANSLFLHWIAPPLESAAGRTRFTIIYLSSILAGSWAQYTFGPFAATFQGASGGAAGVFGAYVLYRLRNRHYVPWDAGDTSWVAQMVGLNVLLALMAGGSLANMAHLGGLFGGAAVCWLIGPRYVWRPGGGLVDSPLLWPGRR